MLTGQTGTCALIAPTFIAACAIELPDRISTQRPGAILSRAELEQRIYGWSDEIESNAVEVIIHGVRRKLGAASIQNVRGAGWRVGK